MPLLAFAPRLLLLLLGVVALAAPPPPAKLCQIVISDEDALVQFFVSRFAVEYYRATLPNFNWTIVSISNSNFDPSVRDAVAVLVNTGADCDAMLGPGSSTYAVPLSPVTSQPWVDMSSSATELSDKTVHPWFNRVIPNNAQIGGAMADVVGNMGWQRVNTLTSNDAYGSSILQQFIASHAARKGLVGITQSLSANAGLAEVHAFLDLLESANPIIRIVVVGTSTANPVFANLINATLTRQLHKKYVFVFSEAACSGDTQWRKLQGSLCVTFDINATKLDAFTAAYNARDVSADVALAARSQRSSALPQIDVYAQSVFTSLAHDAVLAVMTGLNAQGNLSASRAANLAAIRRVQVSGLSGPVRFLANGDRNDLQFNVLNVNAVGAETSIGYLSNHEIARAVNASKAVEPYWLASYYSLSPPDDTIATAFQIELWMIFVAAICLVLLLALVLLGAVARRNREALERMLAVGVFNHCGKALLSLSVLSVKTLVAVNLYFTDVNLGYLIPYYVVVGFGLLSGFAEAFQRVRYVAVVAETDEPLPVDEELGYEQSIRRATVATTVMSDTPSVVLSCVILNTTAGTNQALMLAMIVVTAFFIGQKITILSDILKAMASSNDDDDDDVETLARSAAASLAVATSLTSGDKITTSLSSPDLAAASSQDVKQAASMVGHDPRRARYIHVARTAAVSWRQDNLGTAVVTAYVIPEIMRCFCVSVDTVQDAIDVDGANFGAVSMRPGTATGFKQLVRVVSRVQGARPCTRERPTLSRALEPNHARADVGRRWSGMTDTTVGAEANALDAADSADRGTAVEVYDAEDGAAAR